MSVPLTHRFGRAALIACLAAGLISGGCHWLPEGRLPRLLNLTSDAPQPAEVAEEVSEEASGGSSRNLTAFADEDRAVFARHSDQQQRSLWIHDVKPNVVGRPDDGSAEPSYRWRYPAMEDILARPAGERPDLHGYLSDKDPIVVANAAIALARLGDTAAAKQLPHVVRASRFPTAMRGAAVESLAALPEASALRPLQELIDQYGRPGPTYQGVLHAELIRGLARHADAAEEERFLDALSSSSAEVKVAALTAFSNSRPANLPRQVVQLAGHSKVQVRTAALWVLARRHHREALKRLRSALKDNDLRVRTEAIAALGELGGSEAEVTLQQLLDSPTVRIRAEAVATLGRLGAKQAVIGKVADESWRVRHQVAKALARFPDRDGATAARELLGDASAEVQRDVIVALADWPLPLAGGILLEALESRVLMTRKAATEQLAARWPPADELAADTAQKLPSDQLDELRTRFRKQFGLIDREAFSQALSDAMPTVTVSEAQVDQVERLVREGNIAALEDLGVALIPALEQLVFDRQQALPTVIYRDILPHHGPAFAALDEMDLSDTPQRRRAAARLVELAAERPLSRLATSRLYDLVAADSDQLVWQNALRAVERNPHEPAFRLAYAATGHGSPEVRRRACENLAACPQPQHIKVLLRTLSDTSDSVVCAAVHALGALGQIDDTGPLRRLMTTRNENTRVETAIALARLGDASGISALARLAHSGDPTVQYRVAVAMGEVPDPSFVPALIRLLDAKMAVSRGALNSLPKVVGHDVPQEDAQSPVTTTQRIQRWKRWYHRQNAG